VNALSHVGARLAREGGLKNAASQKPYRYSLTVFKFQFLVKSLVFDTLERVTVKRWGMQR
jgi:hypothetical protein